MSLKLTHMEACPPYYEPSRKEKSGLRTLIPFEHVLTLEEEGTLRVATTRLMQQ
jgi:hypothetical protein